MLRAAPLARVAEALALAGGAMMLLVSLVSTVSVVQRWLTSQPIQGDFELVSVGGGLGAFLCLPWAQQRGANIMVDSFTTRAPAWFNRSLDMLWTLVYAAICGVLAWRTALGAAETIRSHTTTMVLALPFGWAIWPAAGAFAVTALVALFGRRAA